MKRNIVIVEPFSTGFNLIDDVKTRGYQPVVMSAIPPGSEEDRKIIHEAKAMFFARIPKDVPVIDENPNYDEVLAQVRSYDPLLVIVGSEFGVELGTRLASDLGLRGNKWANIDKMTKKSEMHRALADAGVRHIRGRIVKSEAEARAFYEELGTTHVVIKPTRGAGTQGVFFCEGLDETLAVVRRQLALAQDNPYMGDLLMQERIIGKEYIVNTVSCGGKHRLVSMWHYDKLVMNGSYIYNYGITDTRLDVGHSRLVHYAFSVLDAIGIEWGAVHGEYMIDERGPVLIEVNCRPMGASMSRQFLEAINGHHETDVHLDAYLDPEKFEQEARKPYRPKRMGAFKPLIVANDMNLLSAPILQIAKQLKSYHSASLDRMAGDPFISRTRDFETAGGLIYLLSDDEHQVKEDLNFLHLIEMKYPQMLFNELKATDDPLVKRNSLEQMLDETDMKGCTLVFSDSGEESDRATMVNSHQLADAYDSYELGLLDISRQKSYADVESLLQQIFLFLGKLREGARVYVPESTYCHLPYGIDGMEIIFHAAGLSIEAPRPNDSNMLIASK
ncbi:MAG: ATP-grasp domain-containing protein [Prevotella sp.]|nr:ATP-grasp domain-containing protein [Prevotella sp.]